MEKLSRQGRRRWCWNDGGVDTDLIVRGRILWVCVLAGQCIVLSAEPAEAPVSVAVDFGRGADYPLTKEKFALYNSGFVPLSHYERDLHLFREIKAPALRVDLWWGGWRMGHEPVSGSSSSLEYRFDEMDRMAELLNSCGIAPQWAYSYIPPPLQSQPGDAASTPTSTALWGEILGRFADHAADGPELRRVGLHEIYNEPDNRDFFHGTMEDYFALYQEGVRGIRAADKDAVVGGPAIAFTDEWISPFLEFVKSNDLPLDFFSFHFYPGVPYDSKTIGGVIADMRGRLADHPERATTEMHLNEYNSYRIDYPEGGRQDRFAMASAMLHDFAYFLTQPDLVRVHWAQFQDTAGGNWSGMISWDGHRKASFNALRLYSMMPVDRNEMVIKGSTDVEGLASSDNSSAGVLLWNMATTTRTVNLAMNRVPFHDDDFDLYRIDRDHGSWGDNAANEMMEAQDALATRSDKIGLQWTGEIPPSGIVYLSAVNDDGQEETAVRMTGDIVRVLRYFPDRGSRSYADFDRETWTARLGMADESKALQQVGIVMGHVPPVIRISMEHEGDFSKDGMCGVRLDFRTDAGYTRSVLLDCGQSGELVSGEEEGFPWGTMRKADRVKDAGDKLIIKPATLAPPDWDGRLIMTFILKDGGPGSRVKFTAHSD